MQMDITFYQQAEEEKNFRLPLIGNYEQFLEKVCERVGSDQKKAWNIKYHDGEQYCAVDNEVDYQNMITGLTGNAPLIVNITSDTTKNNSTYEINHEENDEIDHEIQNSESDREQKFADKKQAREKAVQQNQEESLEIWSSSKTQEDKSQQNINEIEKDHQEDNNSDHHSGCQKEDECNQQKQSNLSPDHVHQQNEKQGQMKNQQNKDSQQERQSNEKSCSSQNDQRGIQDNQQRKNQDNKSNSEDHNQQLQNNSEDNNEFDQPSQKPEEQQLSQHQQSNPQKNSQEIKINQLKKPDPQSTNISQSLFSNCIEQPHKEKIMEVVQHKLSVEPSSQRVNEMTIDTFRQETAQNKKNQLKGAEKTNQKKQANHRLTQMGHKEHLQNNRKMMQTKHPSVQNDKSRKLQLVCSYCKKSNCSLGFYPAFKHIVTCQQCQYKWSIVPRKIRVGSTSKAPHSIKKQHQGNVCSLCGQGGSVTRLAPFNISMCVACEWKWQFAPVRRFIEMEEQFRSPQ